MSSMVVCLEWYVSIPFESVVGTVDTISPTPVCNCVYSLFSNKHTHSHTHTHTLSLSLSLSLSPSLSLSHTHTHTHTHHPSHSTGYEHSYESASAVSTGSESEFEPAYTKKKRKTAASSDFVRMTSRKRGVVSYKESNSEGGEGRGVSEEGVEGWEEVPAVEDNRETIERVLKKRVGPIEGMWRYLEWVHLEELWKGN